MPVPSPEAVHDMVCEFITAQAEADGSGGGVWAGYREVFLSAEVQDLIRSRLMAEAGGGATKLDEVLWTVCCVDGSTFSVELPEGARVAEAKRAIGAQREVSRFAMELFVKGREEPLEDEARLRSAEKVPLFMLPKPASDRLALEALYKSCGGAGWKQKKGWMTDAELGKWEGVTVDAEGRVIELVLESNNLAGPLPSEIQQLSALQTLRLNRNHLTGRIPAELQDLRELTELNLSDNKLSGLIPAELGQLSKLGWLVLSNNALSGAIPAELGQLGELKYLSLRTNQLSGAIPAELGQLGELNYLILQDNLLLSGQEALQMQEQTPGCYYKCKQGE
jgi:hypothetical protein